MYLIFSDILGMKSIHVAFIAMGTIVTLLIITTAIITLYYLMTPGKTNSKDNNNNNSDNNTMFHNSERPNSLDGYLCPEEGDLPFTLVKLKQSDVF